MNTTTSIGPRGCRNATLWGVLLLCLSGPACFRTPDTSKIPCLLPANCPSGYHCAKNQATNQGICAPGLAPIDGSSADLFPSPGIDGSLGPDTNDARATSFDGTSAAIDANLGGAGGAGGSTGDATSGGSGGSMTPDAPSATGGTTSNTDAPSGTGGTTSTPDAPSGPDAPATLPIGSKCTTDGQCTTGSCVDAHCCDSKCDGTCESCATGTCSFTSTPRKACGGSGKCAGICDKSNTKACTFDSTTVCALQSCSGGVRTNKSICDGQGNCPTQTTINCSTNQCTADGSDCATCTDEPTTTTCVGGHCGTTVNNCGHTVQCSTTCSGTGQTCGGGGAAGMCGCTSVSTSQTCGTSNCGTLTDNCGKQVSCGTCSGSTCVSGTCCTPNCTNKCGVSDGCGGTCPSTCPSPQVCASGACCTPTGCGSRVCGSVSNGCGGTATCGNCPSGQSCSSSGSCACALGAPACGGCLGWDFESGVGSWQIYDSSGNGIFPPLGTARIAPPGGGSQSLAMSVSLDGNSIVQATVISQLCSNSSGLDVLGYTLTAQVYFAGSDFPNSNIFWFGTSGGVMQSGGNLYPGGSTMTANRWYPLSATFAQSLIIDGLRIVLATNSPWNGTIYLDSIALQ